MDKSKNQAVQGCVTCRQATDSVIQNKKGFRQMLHNAFMSTAKTSLAAVAFFAVISCSTAPEKTGIPEKPVYKPEKKVLRTGDTPEMVVPLYYSDIASVRGAEKGSRIAFDREEGVLYVSGKKHETFESAALRGEIIPLSLDNISGMSCTEKNSVVFSDTAGNVFRAKKEGSGSWKEELLFSASRNPVQGSRDPLFTAMAADKDHAYLYNDKSSSIYRYDYKGVPDLVIELKGDPPPVKGVPAGRISSIDIQSSYLYLMYESGLIILADHLERGVETYFSPQNTGKVGGLFTVRHDKTESDILIETGYGNNTKSFALYPLSSMHRMRVTEGFIKKATPPVSGCSHVIADSAGKIIFPVKSNLIDLDSVTGGKITAAGMLHDTESGRILVIASIDY